MMHTHVCRNGRRYGDGDWRGKGVRHAAVATGTRDTYRTLCGRSWHESEAEVGGECEPVGTGRTVTCKRCRAKLEAARHAAV